MLSQSLVTCMRRVQCYLVAWLLVIAFSLESSSFIFPRVEATKTFTGSSRKLSLLPWSEVEQQVGLLS